MASSQNEMRIVLIGRTGNGKSSTGNSLLHSRSAFHSTQSAESITRDCQAEKYQYADNRGQQKALTVVDTPGFFDTNPAITNEAVEKQIAKQIFDMTAPGVHAFLIVISIGRFTPEEKNTVDFIRKIFGQDAVKYCIVVFTNEDRLNVGQTLDEFVSTSSPLRELIQACGNRKFAINNELNGQALEKKTKGLIDMIDNMIRNNNGTFYTNAEYQRIERERREKQRREEEAERQRKKAEEDALIARTREEERKKAAEQIKKIREEEQRKREEEEERRKKKAEEDARIARRREEERKKAAEQIQRTHEEEQKKAEERERKLRSDLNSARDSRRRNDDDDGGSSLLRAFQSMGGLGNSMSPMNCGMGMPSSPMQSGMGMSSSPMHSGMGMPSSPMYSGMEMPSQRMGSARSGIGGAHGGRFTGEYMSTSGAANGRAIYEGARGGQYHMTPGGNRSYLPK